MPKRYYTKIFLKSSTTPPYSSSSLNSVKFEEQPSLQKSRYFVYTWNINLLVAAASCTIFYSVCDRFQVATTQCHLTLSCWEVSSGSSAPEML